MTTDNNALSDRLESPVVGGASAALGSDVHTILMRAYHATT